MKFKYTGTPQFFDNSIVVEEFLAGICKGTILTQFNKDCKEIYPTEKVATDQALVLRFNTKISAKQFSMSNVMKGSELSAV